jgi:hypothetical protein
MQFSPDIRSGDEPLCFKTLRSLTFDVRNDCHGVTVPKAISVLEPSHDLTRLDTRSQRTCFGQTFRLGARYDLINGVAGLL